jgi:hypothetical protein
MFEIKEVIHKKELKQFVDLPFSIYKGSAFWAPPIKEDEIKQLQPETNPAFKSCTTKFWTLWDGRNCIGRIGAIINHDYNQKINARMGRISRMEFFDDEKASALLFDTAESWLREQGMTAVHGPLGFNNLDNQGLLIDGFDHQPSIASVYHFPYYKHHFETHGYQKENDWIEFRLTIGDTALDKARRGAEIVKRRYGFTVKTFPSTKEMQAFAGPVFKMMNEAFGVLPYVTPFNDEMIDYIRKKYFRVLDPRFVKIIMKDDEIVAFIIGMPSLTEAMQKANGKLFPLGVFHIMKAMKKPKVIDLLLTGVAPEYHTSGAAVILFAELQNEMVNHGITQMETTGIFEDNHNVISNWKNFPHIQHKRRRCFVKNL